MRFSTKSIFFTYLSIVVLLTGCSDNALPPIEASGVVESRQVSVSSETGGDILSILVDEGDLVEKGQDLARIDNNEILTQLEQAKANLEYAQAQYDMTVASTEVDMITAKQALEDLYKYHDLAKAEAQQAIASAQDAVRDAERHVNSIKNGSRQVDISSAQANVILFRDILEDAQEDFDKHGNKPEHNVTRALYQAQLAEAQRQYEDAVRLLNNLESSPDEIDLAIAEAELAYAKAQLIIAEADYETLKNGPDPDDIAIAEANIKALEAQVPLVAAELSSAKADYHLLQNQSEKLILSSPIDGVVLYRNQEPGEFAQPGTIIITLTSLDELTVTVYIPEDEYGRISLGDKASVSTDSFPEDTFTAVVSRIADKAEYTPRNVQTQEERKNTVFAIELILNEHAGKLKPGMPVDVVFMND